MSNVIHLKIDKTASRVIFYSAMITDDNGDPANHAHAIEIEVKDGQNAADVIRNVAKQGGISTSDYKIFIPWPCPLIKIVD